MVLQMRLTRLLWLPSAPVLVVGLMAAGISIMRSTAADIDRLRAVQYAYKRA